jgi:hypothetical protein
MHNIFFLPIFPTTFLSSIFNLFMRAAYGVQYIFLAFTILMWFGEI